MFSQWCFEISPENRAYLNNIFSNTIQIEFIKLLRQKITSEIPWVLNNAEAVSTAVFTLIGIYCYCFVKGVECLLEPSMDFVMLYVNLDYALDENLEDCAKKEIIEDIYSYLREGINSPRNKYSETSINIISRLQKRVSNSRLLHTFDQEIESVKLQYSCNDEQKLRSICFLKSQACIDLVAELLGTSEQYSFEIGKCLQLFDDLFDIDLDLDNGIRTYVGKKYLEQGTVDKIIEEIIEETQNIPYFEIQIFFHYAMIIYCSSSKYVSKEIQAEAQKYYPFQISESNQSRIKMLCQRIFYL